MKRSYPEPKLWFPKNPNKYKGNVNNIWIRSSWELRVYKWLDTNPNVLEWNSEEIAIPYISPIDNRWHNYYPDVWAKIKTKDKVQTYIVEIKPYEQTIEPKVKTKITKSYINEIATWGVNSSKWKYAKEYCLDRKWEFKILTERDFA